MKKSIIAEFRGVHRFLSNFFMKTLSYKGLSYSSAEHAYQAAKAQREEAHHWVASAKTPGEAKRRGQAISLRRDWDEIKLETMEEILRAKFSDPVLADCLLDTGNAQLVEGNYWGDEFWGIDIRSGRGQNNLGKLLMKIREELKDG